MMRSTVGPLALALAVSIGPFATAGEPRVLSRYIVFTLDASGVPRPQLHAVVTLAAERTSRSEEELSAWLRAGSAEREHVAVRLLDPAGRVLFREAVSVPRWLRTEHGLHHDGAASPRAEEALLPSPDRAFVVRVPFVAGSRVQLARGSSLGTRTAADSPSVHEFSADALALDPSLPLARFKPDLRPLATSAASSGNRVDLLVMGDGYTAAETGKFTSDTTSILASFFGISPYNAYQNYFNVTPLFAASPQSGADHPPYTPSCSVSYPPTCCADPMMQLDPLQGTFVDTAFDGAFCSNNTHRLLTVNAAKVLAAAAASPDWDEILMVVNDSTYGGSGGGLSVVSTNTNAIDVARHEFGHTFSDLADEYASAYPGYPACSDIAGPACEANATDQTSRDLLKWASWVEPATPLPTPDSPAFASVVGLFEGARYQSTGLYRPQESCLMRTLGVPFCAICSQEFVLRLYRGGWGVPAAGIDTIEPGSENPAPGIVSLAFGSSRTFSVSLLQPVGGPPLALTWTVNGATVPEAAGASYTFTAPAPGQYQLVLTARDTTPLVTSVMAGSSLTRTRAWTVDVGALRDLSITKQDNGSARDGQPLVYTLVARNASLDPAIGATVVDTLPPQITSATWTCSASAGSSCPGAGSGNLNAQVDLAAGGSSTFTVTGTVAAGAARQIGNTATIVPPASFVDVDLTNNSASITTAVARALSFHTVPPCRVVDTRGADAPALAGGTSRTFPVAGRCQIPQSAWAVSANLTVTEPTGPGLLVVFPAGAPVPFASSLNYAAAETRANNLTLLLSVTGEASVSCGQAAGTTHFLLDVNGYFE